MTDKKELHKDGMQKRFISFMRSNMPKSRAFETPMAIYEWFVREYGRPLHQRGQEQAWLAAWAVSIDHGMVKL